MNERKIRLDIQSETGKLNAVLLHRPGPEVENMTPANVQRALYSDILNLSIARNEYRQLSGVLSKVAEVFEVYDLLRKTLDNSQARADLIRRICISESVMQYYDILMDMKSGELAAVLIEGLPARINTLTSFLRNEYYALYPLYNFYFTRDSSVAIGNNALICRMANKVRMRESLIMDAIFRNSGVFGCDIIDAGEFSYDKGQVFIEGGDVLVAREDIMIVGNGVRTSSHGIDFLIDRLGRKGLEGRRHIIVQQLPPSPESFIHLDMVFTLLDQDKCMVFEPLILGDSQYQTVHITLDNGKVSRISAVANIPSVLKRLGMDMEPLSCGGRDEWDQEREQWHSGANFFAIAPGQVLTYSRNIHTLETLDNAGFNIIKADDVISGKASIDGRCAITIDGSELPRGGGGARCMTMPLSRMPVE